MTDTRIEIEGRSRQRIRWRFVPAAFLLIFGGLLVYAGLESLGFMLFTNLPPEVPGREAFELAGQVMSTGGGILWLFAGRWCLQGRWTRTMIAAGVGFACLFPAAVLHA